MQLLFSIFTSNTTSTRDYIRFFPTICVRPESVCKACAFHYDAVVVNVPKSQTTVAVVSVNYHFILVRCMHVFVLKWSPGNWLAHQILTAYMSCHHTIPYVCISSYSNTLHLPTDISSRRMPILWFLAVARDHPPRLRGLRCRAVQRHLVCDSAHFNNILFIEWYF